MTTPEQEPGTPPESIAPVVERTSAAAAAQAAPAVTIPADAPTPAPSLDISSVTIPAPAVSGDPVTPPADAPAMTLTGGPVTSSGPNTPSLLMPTVAAPSSQPTDTPEADKVAIEEPPVDPMNDTDSAEVATTVKMIEPGENPNVHQEFIIEKKGTRGDARALNTQNQQQAVFPDMLPASMVNNLEHPAAARQDDDDARRWSQIVQSAAGAIPGSEMLQGILDRPDAEFRQYLKTERNRVGYSAPQFADMGGGKLSGERAIQRVRALMGSGGLVTVPLYHSGFHITIKTPSESALIEVRRRMENERIELGRYTFGMVFSNTASYTVNIMMDLILEHVTETTLKNQTDLRQRIDALDIPVLMWGMACAVWPNGFQYARALTTEQGILHHQVITGLIDVAKLLWVDNKAFTAKQKAHMSNRVVGSMTDEQIQAYKDDFPLRAGRVVQLAPGISVEFAPPSVEAYIASGRRWVEKLVQIVEGTITNDREDIEGRNRAIVQHGNATYMRQLGHWVKQIKLGEIDKEEVIDDTENVELVLETLSESQEIREAYIAGYRNYVNDITTAIIAIPEAASNDLMVPRFPNLIAIDVISTFFILLMQRVNQLINR
jgi:hypothetical protein